MNPFKTYDRTRVVAPRPVLLRLQDYGSYIALVVVDARGNRVEGGCLMVFDDKGYRTVGGVNQTIDGLPLDGDRLRRNSEP